MCCPRVSHYPRHNGVVDALARSIAASSGHVQKEVPIAGRLRPADLLIHGWEPEGEFVDVTVRHDLATFDNPSAVDRVTGAATAKHIKYDGPCRQANLPFRVFGLSTLSGATPETADVVSSLRSHMCEKFGQREGQLLTQQAVERISVTCMRGVAAELLAGA
jgi:hypothetical protein